MIHTHIDSTKKNHNQENSLKIHVSKIAEYLSSVRCYTLACARDQWHEWQWHEKVYYSKDVQHSQPVQWCVTLWNCCHRNWLRWRIKVKWCSRVVSYCFHHREQHLKGEKDEPKFEFRTLLLTLLWTASRLLASAKASLRSRSSWFRFSTLERFAGWSARLISTPRSRRMEKASLILRQRGKYHSDLTDNVMTNCLLWQFYHSTKVWSIWA